MPPHVFCKDGFVFSVNVGLQAYCSPRDERGPWQELEISFLHGEDEAIQRWMDDSGIAGNVLVEIINSAIRAHGGITGVGWFIKE